MKLQDLFPFNFTIAGVKDIYSTIGDDSHYINCPCIKAENQIIKTGKTYVLINANKNNTVYALSVKVLDVFYHNENIYVLLIDTESQKVMLLNQFMDCNDYHCSWKLIDWDYLQQKADER